ncbi:MAG: DUF2142 domain-containing protein [Candidatus Eremiobacteraeota bacterium]|nr:DUF2142 domain-containing protein [Candidatus Eremiobacteraeota bacterium]
MSDARRANAAATAVILLAGALSAVWVFLVPIFQAPDEPAHFDYAASIYGAHRLIRLSDGSADWIVSPYTKYLLQALDFSRVAMNSSMRVPSGYGSRQYFARIDADAPSLTRAIEPKGRINYIVPAYPVGFYALEAAWMYVVALSTGSLVSVFFAARLLCVFLLMTGLYFNYRTALNLGVPRWVSVALVAGIGFFPMTSFVSSYVQPDNLAYALVSAALFFATRLRSDTAPTRDLVLLAISLALLAVTKYQCFLAVALPALLLIAIRFRFPTAAAVLAPAAALLAVQHWMIGQSNASAGSNVAAGMALDHFRGIAALGFSATLHYVAATTLAAFVDCFVSGACAATFWQVFGWGDTPIFIVNGSIELWIRALVALVTIAVAVAVGWLIARNTARIARASRHGHPRLALESVAADPVFASYVVFVTLMLALYVATNNAFGAEGRHWYAFIFPAFLCLVWYAPSLFRARRRTFSALFAGALCCYSLVAAGYALADVAQRYYGRPPSHVAVTGPRRSELLPGSTGVLWAVKSAAYHVADAPVPAFPIGANLIDSGAALPPTPAAPSVVAALLDGKPVPVIAGEYQFTIAEATHDLADAYSQFYAGFSTKGLDEGPHVVAAYAAAPDGRHYRPVGVTRTFFLTADDGRFSRAYLRRLQRAPYVSGSLQVAGRCNGGIALLAGQIGESRLDPYRGLWLLVDGRPYQSRYDDGSGTFAATVPTADLALGLHRVVAYGITDAPGRPVRIVQSAAFRVVRGRGTREYFADPPLACRDPLHQLAGTNL